MRRLVNNVIKNIRKQKKLVAVSVTCFVLFIIVLLTIASNGKIKTDYWVATPEEQATSVESFNGSFSFNMGSNALEFEELFLSSVRSAHHEIYLAMYSIEDSAFIELLQEKQNEGVRVHIVVPLRKEYQHNIAFASTDLDLIAVGDPAGTEYAEESNRFGLMHHKFIIVDPGTSTQQVIVSSSNITELQFGFDPGFAFQTGDPVMVETFLREFTRLAKGITSTKKLRSGGYQPFALDTQYPEGNIQIWFGPGYLENSVRTGMLALIENAKRSIKILGWVINDRDIWNAIVKRAHEGVDVSVIVDDHFLWDGSSSIKVSRTHDILNLTIASDSYTNIVMEREGLLGTKVGKDFNSFLHHHTLIVDDTYLVTGTNNWSRGGFYYNDETMMVTTIPALVYPYVEEWNRLSDELVGESMQAIYNTETTEVTFDRVPSQTTEILIYREESEPLWLGSICTRVSILDIQKVKVPFNCATERTRIFAIDEHGDLLASTYLDL